MSAIERIELRKEHPLPEDGLWRRTEGVYAFFQTDPDRLADTLDELGGDYTESEYERRWEFDGSPDMLVDALSDAGLSDDFPALPGFDAQGFAVSILY